jgi:hypothetical protein
VSFFQKLMTRDDLICDSEDDVLQAISTYVTRQSGQIKDELRRELMMCVRFENLDANTLQ